MKTLRPPAAMPPLAGLRYRLAGIGMLSLLLVCTPGRAAAHGAYHHVVQKLERLIVRHPENSDLHYRLALAHSDHEEWQLCLDETAIIERLKPGKYPTGYLRGKSFLQAGKHPEARTTLDAFLSQDPTHAQALATRGEVLMALNLPTDAVADFRKAIQYTTPPNPTLFLQLANGLKASGLSKEALTALDDGLSKLGAIPELQHRALELAIALQDWNSALSRIAVIRESAPSPEPWMAGQARLLDQAGRPDQARAAWSALKAHLDSLPSLDRGTPANLALWQEAKSALGEPVVTQVSIPPAAN